MPSWVPVYHRSRLGVKASAPFLKLDYFGVIDVLGDDLVHSPLSFVGAEWPLFFAKPVGTKYSNPLVRKRFCLFL